MNKQIFLDNIQHYTSEIHPTFSRYFNTEDELVNFISSLPGDDAKKDFLYLASMYHFLVRSSQLTTNGTVVQYLDNTHKFITLVSLLESLSPNNYKDLFSWLMSKDRGDIFPLDKEKLKTLFEEYKSEHGITQGFVATFSKIAAWLKTLLSNKLFYRKSPGKIVLYSSDKLASQLYQIRSAYIHRMELPFEFDANLGIRKGMTFYSQLTIKQLEYVFEHALLSSHGYPVDQLESTAPEDVETI